MRRRGRPSAAPSGMDRDLDADSAPPGRATTVGSPTWSPAVVDIPAFPVDSPGRAPRTCGQRSTVSTDTVTIRVMRRATLAPSHPAAGPHQTLAGPPHPPTRRRARPRRAAGDRRPPGRPPARPARRHPERTAVLAHAVAAEVAPDEARALLDALRGRGPGRTRAHPAAEGPGRPPRARLTAEAEALALASARLPGTPAAGAAPAAGRPGGGQRPGRLGAPVAPRWPRPGSGTCTRTWPARRGRGPGRPGIPAAALGRRSRRRGTRRRRAGRPGTGTGPLRRGRVDLSSSSVRTGRPPCSPPVTPSAASRTCCSASGRDVPVVGPLVRPAAGPCLNCLDLHRRGPRPGLAGARRPAATGAGRAEPCADRHRSWRPRRTRRPRCWPTSTAGTPDDPRRHRGDHRAGPVRRRRGRRTPPADVADDAGDAPEAGTDTQPAAEQPRPGVVYN